MNILTRFLSHHAKLVLVVGLALLLAAGAYGLGLFNTLSDANDNFFANGTSSEQTNQKVKDIFGTDDTKTSIVLFEAKDRSANVRDNSYAKEVSRILGTLDTTNVVTYYGTHSDQLVSRDGHDTYAIVTMSGTPNEQYKALTSFNDSVKSDLFNVSIGGTLVGQRQTMNQAKEDLSMAEMISLPILAVLLFLFFRGPVAAAIPLGMSILTILGALAVARVIHMFVAIDTYTLNVITILGVGLSIDYSLLMVNRFREQLHEGHTPAEAARITSKTAGRTVFFSGLTVIICLLALLTFPVGFMMSVSIGGAAAVLVAVIISALLLPPALQLMGKSIDKWSMKPRTTVMKGWKRLAEGVTRHPFVALIAGIIVIAGLVWPVGHFQTSTFDWRTLPSNQSAYHVGQVMSERFDIKTPSLTVLATFDSEPTISQLCELSKTISSVDGVDSVQTAYSPSETMPNCETMPSILAKVKTESPQQAALIEKNAAKYLSGNYARVEVVSTYESSDKRIRTVISDLASADYGSGVQVAITGMAARSQDTLDTYLRLAPIVVSIIAVAMIIVLGLSLGSILLPLQAILINSVALFISLGVLVMIFQFGWGANVLGMTSGNGFELSIPILVFVMAFGLSMDYAVFLYSRMHEIYDKTGNPHEAIVGGVAKTGPIITAAALLMFVVVSAFATSHISLIQQIGVGLAVAVLVDAFFVRVFFVPAVMQLFGKASWWGPKWLKKITIKHD